MNLAFYGTPVLSGRYLEALVQRGHNVRYVVTRPPRRRGRGANLTPSPVAEVSERLGIRTVNSISEAIGVTESEPVDVSVVVAYGRIIPVELLDRNLFLNLHYSLLPNYRGAAPMERAILDLVERTGVCLMKMEEGLDTGPIYEVRSLEIGGLSLLDLAGKLTDLGIDLLLEWLDRRDLISFVPTPQVGEPTYAHKVSQGDYRIVPTDSVAQALARVRLGRGYVVIQDKKAIIVEASTFAVPPDGQERVLGSFLEIARGRWGLQLHDGVLSIEAVRPEGRPTMDFAAYLRGIRADGISAG